MSPLTDLAEVIPQRHARIALAWFSAQLHVVADRRDLDEIRLVRNLGAPGTDLAAHRVATLQLRELADRWDNELAPPDSCGAS